MNKKDIIELGEFIIAGILVSAVIKAIACIAAKAVKAKAAQNTNQDDVVTVKKEINFEDIPAEIRAKLEK